MVFMIINFIVGAGLMAFAFTSDHVASGQKEYQKKIFRKHGR